MPFIEKNKIWFAKMIHKKIRLKNQIVLDLAFKEQTPKIKTCSSYKMQCYNIAKQPDFSQRANYKTAITKLFMNMMGYPKNTDDYQFQLLKNKLQGI